MAGFVVDLMIFGELSSFVYKKVREMSCWQPKLEPGPRLDQFEASVRVRSTFLTDFFVFLCRKFTFGGPETGSEKKSIKRDHHTSNEQIWARSGGCPNRLWALENVCTVAKQLKRGTLIGPSDSAKNPSSSTFGTPFRPTAFLFVWGCSKSSAYGAINRHSYLMQGSGLLNPHSGNQTMSIDISSAFAVLVGLY